MMENDDTSVSQLRPRSILLAAAILDLVDSVKRKEPALDNEDVLEALELTHAEVVESLEEREWN